MMLFCYTCIVELIHRFSLTSNPIHQFLKELGQHMNMIENHGFTHRSFQSPESVGSNEGCHSYACTDYTFAAPCACNTFQSPVSTVFLSCG